METERALEKTYDAIVVGAGHAGVEAAAALARTGHKTLLLTLSLDAVSFMACNPNVGGTAKGHLVRELSALGGLMGKIADQATIQSRMLNLGNGPAVHSLRAQVDKALYHRLMKRQIENMPNLSVIEGEAAEILTENGAVSGIITTLGQKFAAKTAVLATGVYLSAKVIIGDSVRSSGPSCFAPATRLTDSLVKLGLPIRRFKTGTPPRVLRRSVDFGKMEIQNGDENPTFFYYGTEEIDNSAACWLTYTNAETHKIITDNLMRAPMYNGSISGVGPRYCPSIETKIVRFADKERHQVFVEPEGKDTDEMYLQGLSTSLPYDVQERMVHSVKGLERAEITRYGYAIEYDAIDPAALYPTLETKCVKNLFTAGQINGSSGYEEAAVQGFAAGINAARRLDGKDGYVFGRDGSYIGVLIDDLVTKGTEEPYRMMTARAEHRLYLRQDNADLRLTEIGRELGTVGDEQYAAYLERVRNIENVKEILKRFYSPKKTAAALEAIGDAPVSGGITGEEFARRPKATVEAVQMLDPKLGEYGRGELFTAVVDARYDGYLRKEERRIAERKRLEEIKLPAGVDYSQIDGLRLEAKEKLAKVKPLTVGQAARISGVSPADVTVLILKCGRSK